ncbi:MAG: carbamoyltransferase C-terminal domain-containing protein [Nocardioidaceae bacterium]
MKVLGINAIFHDPAAALVIDGETVAAAEEERFSRRKHGKRPVPFAAWELPELAAQWCLRKAGIDASDLDAVAYSFDPNLARPAEEMGLNDPWDHLRQTYAKAAPNFLATSLPGLDPAAVRYVPHHVAHAASAGLASPHEQTDVLVLDGRGESVSHLAGQYVGGKLEILASQALPHSLGLLYEDVTQHLGFLRSSDEYKVMALASYGTPRHVGDLRHSSVHHRRRWLSYRSGGLVEPRQAARGGRAVDPRPCRPCRQRAEAAGRDPPRVGRLAARAHRRHRSQPRGGVALNCVANTRLYTETAYEDVWVQPAAGDAGTALGGALHVARADGDVTSPMPGADLGRSWTDAELEAHLITARVPYTRPPDVAVAVAECLADNGIVAWFQGRSEYGPRALGFRSLLAHPGHSTNLERLNDVKGREQFRPVAPMVRRERVSEIFSRGPASSPYMLFVHDVDPQWRERIPAVVHVDGTARVQTVDDSFPLLARMLEHFERRTGIPVVINTSLNTAGRPMVDDPRDALECFGSAPVDLLALGPFVVRRPPMP